MAIKLKAARVNADLTQDDVAKALCISKNTIINYEKYKRKPSVERARELAKLYGMSVDDIVWSAE